MKKRALAEEALCAEHAFRTAMENSLTVGMRARDRNGKITYVNPAFAKMTGFSSQDLSDKRHPCPIGYLRKWMTLYAINSSVLAGNAPIEGFEITFRRKKMMNDFVLWFTKQNSSTEKANTPAGWLYSRHYRTSPSRRTCLINNNNNCNSLPDSSRWVKWPQPLPMNSTNRLLQLPAITLAA